MCCAFVRGAELAAVACFERELVLGAWESSPTRIWSTAATHGASELRVSTRAGRRGGGAVVEPAAGLDKRVVGVLTGGGRLSVVCMNHRRDHASHSAGTPCSPARLRDSHSSRVGCTPNGTASSRPEVDERPADLLEPVTTGRCCARARAGERAKRRRSRGRGWRSSSSGLPVLIISFVESALCIDGRASVAAMTKPIKMRLDTRDRGVDRRRRRTRAARTGRA